MKTTTPQELAYWLQGFFEITDAKVLTTDQVKKIKDKVASCFSQLNLADNPKSPVDPKFDLLEC